VSKIVTIPPKSLPNSGALPSQIAIRQGDLGFAAGKKSVNNPKSLVIGWNWCEAGKTASSG
jgi:hypothetical protein